MSRFTAHDSVEKQKTRDYVLKEIKKLRKRKPRLLTLPADNFLFEKMVLKQYPNAVIDCMENDLVLYNQMKKNLPCKVSYEFGDVFDKLQDNPNTYDIIWLDLCGNLSAGNLNNILASVQNSLKKNSIFAVTLSCNREQRIKVFTKLYNCIDMDHFRFKMLPRMIVKMARLFHPNFSLQKIIRYRNGGTATPMSLYLFTNS